MKVYLRAGLRIAVATTLFFAIAAFAQPPNGLPAPGPVPPALSAAQTIFVFNAGVPTAGPVGDLQQAREGSSTSPCDSQYRSLTFSTARCRLIQRTRYP